MNEEFYLGVDIGGSKCHALITNDRGKAIGFGHYGAGNYEVVGWDGLNRALSSVTSEALNNAGISIHQLTGAGFGIAGYDWPSERKPHVDAIEKMGFTAPYALVNDTIIGLVAGTTHGWGIGVVSGTGCNCWGRDMYGKEGHVTGEGGRFAEWGGGADLVRHAVQMVSLAWSKRGPATKLTEAIITLTGASDATDLLEGLTLGRYSINADAAPVVFQVASNGDEVATETIRWAGKELGSLAVGVIHQLTFESLPVEIVQIGSLFNGSPILGETMMAVIQEAAPLARAIRLNVPPVVGAVLLGLEQAGLDFTPFRETLIYSTQEFMENEPLS
jgi:N-acetylglucosamine kinase-like BadF-type ATPase